MREIPLLATDDVVRRILSGAQTQDRTPLIIGRGKDRKPVPSKWHVYVLNGAAWMRPSPSSALSGQRICDVPRYRDSLWVREATKGVASGSAPGPVRYGVAYRADGAIRWNERTTEIHMPGAVGSTGPLQFKDRPWRRNIHMRRLDCRLVLPIVRVWVERIQDITEESALAEGMKAWEEHWWTGYDARSDSYPAMLLEPGDRPPEWMENPRLRVEKRSARENFRVLWNSLYPGSWERNDWVSGVEWARTNEVKP